MLDHRPWTCPPQVKDLPRDTQISVTCRTCASQWSESVQHLIEAHKMGADYVDLLEWKYRCIKDGCDGLVRFTFDAAVMPEPYAQPKPVTLSHPKLPERLPYPSKAVVKPRLYAEPMIPPNRRQLSLPLLA